MQKVVIFGAVVGLLFLFAPAVPAQGLEDTARLKREIELLKKENELLKKEIELLKREVARKGASQAGDGDATGKPAAEADGVDYVVEKVVRKGTNWLLVVTAVNSKADRKMEFYAIEAVDTDGNPYRSKFPRTQLATLRKEVKTKIEFVLPQVPAAVKEMACIELHRGPRELSEYPIGTPYPKLQFKNVRVGK